MPNLEVTSAAFENEGSIPVRYTCEGEDVSPPLSWSAGPDGTACYALIVEDPDAPNGNWVHWVAWNIQSTSLEASVPTTPKLQNGIRQGKNSWGSSGYRGPCPPSGTHRYFFRVLALDRQLQAPEGTEAQGFSKIAQGHVLATGELMGRYAKQSARARGAS